VSFTLRTGAPAPASHPRMPPLPAGIDAPKELRAASDRYVKAREKLGEAYRQREFAASRLADAQHADQRAAEQAFARGERRSSVQPTVGPFEKDHKAAQSRYSAALRDAVAAELHFAEQLFDARPGWLEALEAERADALAETERLLRELEPALLRANSAGAAVSALRAWRFDPEVPEDQRVRRLHSESARSLPEFRNVERERARNARRMDRVRHATTADPRGRELPSSGQVVA
jgi:hypothetical protein